MGAIVFDSGDPSSEVTITGNKIESEDFAVEILHDVVGLAVVGNVVEGGLLWCGGAKADGVVSDNTCRVATDDPAVGVFYDGPVALAIRGNMFQLGGTGVILNAASSGGPEGVEIDSNTFDGPGEAGSSNTDDAIRVTAGQAFIHGNKIKARTSTPLTRSAVYLDTGAHDCMVVGNDLGDVSAYGTDAYVDGGSNNLNEWPADATYGDNFTH